MDEMHVWMGACVDGCMYGWVHVWMRCMCGWVHVWMDACVDEMHVWMRCMYGWAHVWYVPGMNMYINTYGFLVRIDMYVCT